MTPYTGSLSPLDYIYIDFHVKNNNYKVYDFMIYNG